MKLSLERRVLEAVRRRRYVRLAADGEPDPAALRELAASAGFTEAETREALRALVRRGELRTATMRLLDTSLVSPSWLVPAEGAS